MKFEWDPAKNESNLAKHGVTFEEAVEIFAGPTLNRTVDRQDYGEELEISLGELFSKLVLVVIHTRRGDSVRLISARKANRGERKVYDDYLKRAQERD